jgi:hypothetical protein
MPIIISALTPNLFRQASHLVVTSNTPNPTINALRATPNWDLPLIFFAIISSIEVALSTTLSDLETVSALDALAGPSAGVDGVIESVTTEGIPVDVDLGCDAGSCEERKCETSDRDGKVHFDGLTMKSYDRLV